MQDKAKKNDFNIQLGSIILKKKTNKNTSNKNEY